MLQMLLARLTDKLLVFQETGTPPASQEKPVTREGKTKTNVHLTQQTSCISSIATRTTLDKFMQKEINVLAALDFVMQLRG